MDGPLLWAVEPEKTVREKVGEGMHVFFTISEGVS